MRPPGRAARITASLDAQAPGVRTTRFCRTRDRTGRVRAAQPLTENRPAIACAPMRLTSTATRSAYRDDRETPLCLDRDGRYIRYFRSSVKSNVVPAPIDGFHRDRLPWPTGQRRASATEITPLKRPGPEYPFAADVLWLGQPIDRIPSARRSPVMADQYLRLPSA